MSLLLRLYPRAWRERYGEEFLALLADHPPTLRGRLDICRCALDARLHYKRRSAMPRRRYTCSFCGRPDAGDKRLIAGPGGIAICFECVALGTNVGVRDAAERCSFCGISADRAASLTTSKSGVTICDGCVALCVQIIGERDGGGPAAPEPPGGRRRGDRRWRRILGGRHQAHVVAP